MAPSCASLLLVIHPISCKRKKKCNPFKTNKAKLVYGRSRKAELKCFIQLVENQVDRRINSDNHRNLSSDCPVASKSASKRHGAKKRFKRS